MAVFKAVIRNKISDNTYLIYIRCTHNRKVAYIKTAYYVEASKVKDGEIKDNDVNIECAAIIRQYRKRLLEIDQDIDVLGLEDIVNLLTEKKGGIPFVPFANGYIRKLSKAGKWNSANNYSIALRSFIKECGEITFHDITSKVILKWIEKLSSTSRAKQMYPTAIKTMFDAGCLEYNDYDKGIIKIANQPFKLVKIPKAEEPKKRAIDIDIIKRIFRVKPKTNRAEMSQDVVKIIFFLAGINTVDIYSKDISVLKIKEGKICYNRNKTMGNRGDKAYTELIIPEQIKPILEKYKDEFYFTSFHDRYSDSNEFNRYVNRGLKVLCESAGVDKVDTYTFRHTWATIAKNNCGATDEEIDLCLNHVPVHKMARKYIKVDYSAIDKINKKVIDYVFKRRINVMKFKQVINIRKTSPTKEKRALDVSG